MAAQRTHTGSARQASRLCSKHIVDYDSQANQAITLAGVEKLVMSHTGVPATTKGVPASMTKSFFQPQTRIQNGHVSDQQCSQEQR